jgi:hypothetical protein
MTTQETEGIRKLEKTKKSETTTRIHRDEVDERDAVIG